MKLSEVGEFGLIERLRALAGPVPEGEVWIGDDAAVIRAGVGTLLFTTDMLVEGVHFDLQLTGAEDLGYKSIAVNISDIAAMGGAPSRALVSIGVRPGIEMEWLEALYKGMREVCDGFGMAVAGGDTSRSDCLVISVALVGNAGSSVVRRSGARPGDVVGVTGVLGASAAGYRLLRAGSRDGADLAAAHLRPVPRVREAKALGSLPTSMIDVSDGFAADLLHICDESKVGVVIDADSLPLPDLSGIELDRDPLELAIGGGEDYELCFTVPAGRFDEAAAEVEKTTGTKVTRVGEIIPQTQGRWLVRNGERKPLEAAGWDHLKS